MTDPGHDAYQRLKKHLKAARGASKNGAWQAAESHAREALKAATECRRLLEPQREREQQ